MFEPKSLRQLALDLLSRREHSRFELQHKLNQHDFPTDAIITNLDKLESENLLSDLRFTEAYITMRSKRGYGPERIKQELHARGVSAIVIKQYLDSFNEQWQTLAAQARQKKFGENKPANFLARLKQQQFLHYRGFTSKHITTTLNNLETSEHTNTTLK